MSKEKTVSLTEGAEMLLERLLAEPDRQKQLTDILAIFREVEKKAVHEAAIVYKLGGKAALIRLFEHHGIKWSGPEWPDAT